MATALKYLARKPITIAGRHYGAGEVVDMERVVPARRKQLLEQRRVTSIRAESPTKAKRTAKKE